MPSRVHNDGNVACLAPGIASLGTWSLYRDSGLMRSKMWDAPVVIFTQGRMMFTHHPAELKFHEPSEHYAPGFASLRLALRWKCQAVGAHSHKSARRWARADVPQLDSTLLPHVSIPILKDSADGEVDRAEADGETGQIAVSSWLDGVFQPGCVSPFVCTFPVCSLEMESFCGWKCLTGSGQTSKIKVT